MPHEEPPPSPTLTVATVLDPASSPALNSAPELESGARVGRYLILHRAGSGAMGVVYAAYDPELDRRIAIKLLRSSYWNEACQNRVLSEARTMAKLSHPNVVGVFDVGTWGDQVFVAMELVDGVTLREWLAAEPRSWRQVADVMAGAARGLAAAHDAGIVHRDVKPTNIVVTPQGQARVLDFGVARSSEPEGLTRPPSGAFPTDGKVESTQDGEIVGTPAYMAPEQRRGIATAKSDQYGFFVTLYEALVGHRPDPVDTASITRGEQPGRSAPELDKKLMRGGHAVPRWLWRVIRRGLTTDPDARHATMHEVAAQLSRRPEQRRLQMFASAALAACVGVGAFALSRQMANPAPDPCSSVANAAAQAWNDSRQDALKSAFSAVGRSYAAETAARVARLLGARTEAWSAMRQAACAATWTHGAQSEQLLDLRMTCLDRRLSEQDELTKLLVRGVNADVVDKSIQAVRSLPALSTCSDTSTLLAAYPPPANAAAARAVEAIEKRVDYAKALRLAGRFDAAVVVLAPQQAQAEALHYPPLSAELLLELSISQAESGQAESAERTLAFALPAAARAHDDTLLATAMAKWVFVLGYLQDRHAEALAARPIAEAATLRSGENSEPEAELMTALGSAYINKGDFVAARACFERAAALIERLYGSDDPRRARVLNNLGLILEYQDNHDAAIPYLEQAIALWQRTLGADHPSVAVGLNNLGLALSSAGRDAEARGYFERALKIWERAHGPEHSDVGMVLANLASSAQREGKLDEAQAIAERALAIHTKIHGASNHRTALSALELAKVLLERKQAQQACDLIEGAVKVLDAALTPEHPFGVDARVLLAAAKLELGQAHDAAQVLEGSLAVALKEEMDALPEVKMGLARALWAAREQRPRALTLAREALEIWRSKAKPTPIEQEEIVKAEAWLAHPT